MRYFLISDNSDTLTGLRLAGVEGVRAETREETLAAIEAAAKDPSVGILLINEKLAALLPGTGKRPEAHLGSASAGGDPRPAPHGRAPDSITRYIREAIGIKV